MQSFKKFIAEADKYCSDECCGSNVKAEDCPCPPDCAHCDCNAEVKESFDPKHPKVVAARKAHKAGTYNGNVDKNGNAIVHIDGKPHTVTKGDPAARNEDTEQLDELSPATLKSYKKKATKQYKQSANKRMPGGGDYGSATKKAQDKHQKRFDKRHKGIGSEIKRTSDSDIHLKDPKGLVRKDPKSNSMTGKPAPYKNRAESLDHDLVDEAVGTSAKHAGKTGVFGGKYTSKDHMIHMKNFNKIRDKKRKQRDAEHAKQDPKMNKMGYAKHMLDTDKADAKARKRGIDPTGKYDKYKKKNGIREELDDDTINQLTAEYINENNITMVELEAMSPEQLDEIIGKAIGGLAKAAIKTGAAAIRGGKAAAQRVSTAGRADAAEKKAAALEKKKADRDRIQSAKDRVKAAKDSLRKKTQAAAAT